MHGEHTLSPIGAHPGQNYADRIPSGMLGNGLKQHIYARSLVMHARSIFYFHQIITAFALQQHVTISRRDQRHPGGDVIAVMHHGDWTYGPGTPYPTGIVEDVTLDKHGTRLVGIAQGGLVRLPEGMREVREQRHGPFVTQRAERAHGGAAEDGIPGTESFRATSDVLFPHFFR